MLAGAEELAGYGHTRSSLTEAITALEVALTRFGKSPRMENVQPSEVLARMGIERLAHQIEHLGLTGSVSYLLPLLFPEAVMSAALLSGVRDAIQQRQTVVHSGAGEVDPNRLQTLLRALRDLCAILEKHTNK